MSRHRASRLRRSQRLDRRAGDGDARALVVDGYLRTAADRGAGLHAAQLYETQIRTWAASRGWRIGRIFDEPGLGLALSRVESGESDGLIVAHFWQVGSSLEDALTAVERVRAAGGRFVSVADGIDLDTPHGRLVLRLLLSVSDQTIQGVRT